jgi:hypothetical protein
MGAKADFLTEEIAMPKNDVIALNTKKIDETSLEPRKPVPEEILDQLPAGYKKPEDLLGPTGLLKQLIGQLVTRAMGAEMNHHLGYQRGQARKRIEGGWARR